MYQEPEGNLMKVILPPTNPQEQDHPIDEDRTLLKLEGFAVRWDTQLGGWAIYPPQFRNSRLVRLESACREHPSVWSCHRSDLARVLELLR